MGADLADASGWPSWPQAAISSSPLLSRMVHTRPPCIKTLRKARIWSMGEDLNRVPAKALKQIKLTCKGRENTAQRSVYAAVSTVDCGSALQCNG